MGGFVGAFYSGFVPILFKQIPYTMAKFAVQGNAAESIYGTLGKTPKEMSASGNIGVSLLSGVMAGAGGSGSMMQRLGNIAAETGFVTLCTQGLGARCIMIGTLTAGQFGVFDIVMGMVGAKKFHFHDPKH